MKSKRLFSLPSQLHQGLPAHQASFPTYLLQCDFSNRGTWKKFIQSQRFLRGGSRIFLGGGTLVSCSTSTPINHIVSFFYRIPVVLENRRSCQGGRGSTPLHPPPRCAAVSENKIFSIFLTKGPIKFKVQQFNR